MWIIVLFTLNMSHLTTYKVINMKLWHQHLQDDLLLQGTSEAKTDMKGCNCWSNIWHKRVSHKILVNKVCVRKTYKQISPFRMEQEKIILETEFKQSTLLADVETNSLYRSESIQFGNTGALKQTVGICRMQQLKICREICASIITSVQREVKSVTTNKNNLIWMLAMAVKKWS